MNLRRRDSANREVHNDDVLGRFIRLLAKTIVQRLKRDLQFDKPPEDMATAGPHRRKV